ncbi:MAG: MFS transporter [Candidatus Hodarchaeales archaeon]
MSFKNSLENRIILWVSIGHFMNHVGNYLTPALLIYLQDDIFLTQTERGLLGTIPMLMLVVLSTFTGWLGDKKPLWRKTMIYLGLIGIGIFGIIMSFANSFLELAIATIILGISLSTYHPIAFSQINSMPNKDKNMGINAVAGNFGSAITPLVAMVIAVFLGGWRLAFLIFSITQILTGITFAVFCPSDAETNNYTNGLKENGSKDKEVFIKKQMIVLVLLLVTISAFRAPVFRTLSYFTAVIFRDAFNFQRVESSIITAIALGIGSVAAFLAGWFNNNQIQKKTSDKKARVNVRINTMLVSNGVSTFLLFVLAFIARNPKMILISYLGLTFFFFLGASILPTIISEVTSASGMGSAFGFLFAGATITGAIAPTIFGWLADNYSFSEGFMFLGIIASGCFSMIVIFKIIFSLFSQQNHK